MNLRLILFFGLPVTLVSSLPAVVWDGGGNNTFFNNGANWNSNNNKAIPKLPSNSNANNGESATFNSSASPTFNENGGTVLLSVGNGSTVNLTTGIHTLSLGSSSTDLVVTSGSTLNFSGNLSGASGFGSLNFDIDGAAVFTGNISNTGNSINVTGGGDTTLVNTTVSGTLNVGAPSTLKGSGTVTENLTMNGNLSPGVTGEGSINVQGSMDGSGTWIFDAVDSSTRDLVMVTGQLDVSGFDLNLSGLTVGSTQSGPVIIANYGSLSGGPFNSVSGLLAGQFINYDYQGTGAIAIVPEVTHLIPLLFAFLPIVTARNRKAGRWSPA